MPEPHRDCVKCGGRVFWSVDPKWSAVCGLFGTCSKCGHEETTKDVDRGEGISGYRQRKLVAAFDRLMESMK